MYLWSHLLCFCHIKTSNQFNLKTDVKVSELRLIDRVTLGKSRQLEWMICKAVSRVNSLENLMLINPSRGSERAVLASEIGSSR